MAGELIVYMDPKTLIDYEGKWEAEEALHLLRSAGWYKTIRCPVTAHLLFYVKQRPADNLKLGMRWVRGSSAGLGNWRGRKENDVSQRWAAR